MVWNRDCAVEPSFESVATDSDTPKGVQRYRERAGVVCYDRRREQRACLIKPEEGRIRTCG